MVDAQNQAKVRTLLDTAFGTLCSTPLHIDERCRHQPPFAIALAPHWNASAQQEPCRASGYALDHLIKRRTAIAKQATKTKPLVIRHRRILTVEVQSRAAYDFSNGTNRFFQLRRQGGRSRNRRACIHLLLHVLENGEICKRSHGLIDDLHRLALLPHGFCKRLDRAVIDLHYAADAGYCHDTPPFTTPMIPPRHHALMLSRTRPEPRSASHARASCTGS